MMECFEMDSDPNRGPHPDVQASVLPEAQLLTGQAEHAGTSRTDHLHSGSVADAKLVKSMDLTGIAGNLLDLGGLTGDKATQGN
jgi:hypothetical protein